MSSAHDAVDSAIKEGERLRKFLKTGFTKQVRSLAETSAIRATALTWFRNHRPSLSNVLDDPRLVKIDQVHRDILAASGRSTLRSRYDTGLKELNRLLIGLRSDHVLKLTAPAGQTSDQPPKFAPLISDARMQAILARRWKECVDCIAAGAPLAACVMMGGLLEALLLARIQRETNQSRVFNAQGSPRDKKTGKSLPLQKWTLRNYIGVAHEIGWISHSAKDVGEVLKDYRNYIHPYKELSHGISLTKGDAEILWGVSKTIAKQILESTLRS